MKEKFEKLKELLNLLGVEYTELTENEIAVSTSVNVLNYFTWTDEDYDGDAETVKPRFETIRQWDKTGEYPHEYSCLNDFASLHIAYDSNGLTWFVLADEYYD